MIKAMNEIVKVIIGLLLFVVVLCVLTSCGDTRARIHENERNTKVLKDIDFGKQFHYYQRQDGVRVRMLPKPAYRHTVQVGDSVVLQERWELLNNVRINESPVNKQYSIHAMYVGVVKEPFEVRNTVFSYYAAVRIE